MDQDQYFDENGLPISEEEYNRRNMVGVPPAEANARLPELSYKEGGLSPTPAVEAPVNYRDLLYKKLTAMANKDTSADAQAMADAQNAAASSQAQLLMLEGATNIGRAGLNQDLAKGAFAGAQDLAKQQLNDYLMKRKAERDADADQLAWTKELADLETEKQRQDNWNKEYKLKSKTSTSTAPTPFEKALDVSQAKSFAKLQENSDKAAANLDAVNQASEMFENYSKNSIGGTGRMATMGGLTKYLREGTEGLDTKFKDLALTKMTTMFQGMSKAVDSDAERKAFEATNPSITLDDDTNRERLLGLKAVAKRNLLEVESQREWVNSNGDLRGYVSPQRNLQAVVDASGEVQLVPKGKLPEGYIPIDQFAKSGKVSTPTTPTDAISYLSPDKQKRIQELRAKQAASAAPK